MRHTSGCRNHGCYHPLLGSSGPDERARATVPRYRRTTGILRRNSGQIMWLLYLLALILGGGILLVQLLAGTDHHAVDHGAFDHGDHGGPHPYEGPGVLSIRSATYGLFTFGLVGGVLHVLALASPGLALAGGLATGALT